MVGVSKRTQDFKPVKRDEVETKQREVGVSKSERERERAPQAYHVDQIGGQP